MPLSLHDKKYSEVLQALTNMHALLRRFPFTSAALLLAAVVSLTFSAMVVADRRDWFPNILKPLLLGGMLPFYVVGTLSESPTLSLLAFYAGTLALFIPVALALDGILNGWRWWYRHRTDA